MNGVISDYYDKDAMAAAVDRGDHRTIVGGLWDEIGDLQLRFLKAHGLTTDSKLLDIGCGSLRLGIRAVDYLARGNYWGTDLNPALLTAGYEREIVPAGLSWKLPRSNLIVDENFRFEGVPSRIEFAIATSVFTHLPLNHMRFCLSQLAKHVAGPCDFFFTIFTPLGEVTESHRQAKGDIVTHSHRDPYHYTISDVRYAAADTPWAIDFIGEWDHPRNQMMVKAHKD